MRHLLNTATCAPTEIDQPNNVLGPQSSPKCCAHNALAIITHAIEQVSIFYQPHSAKFKKTNTLDIKSVMRTEYQIAIEIEISLSCMGLGSMLRNHLQFSALNYAHAQQPNS